jgi:hypothetical protein
MPAGTRSGAFQLGSGLSMILPPSLRLCRNGPGVDQSQIYGFCPGALGSATSEFDVTVIPRGSFLAAPTTSIAAAREFTVARIVRSGGRIVRITDRDWRAGNGFRIEYDLGTPPEAESIEESWLFPNKLPIVSLASPVVGGDDVRSVVTAEEVMASIVISP